MLVCLICKKKFKHLGSHIWHRHKIVANQYKMRFGLDINHALVTQDISEKQRKQSAKHNTWKKNFKKSIHYRFKPGHKKRVYFSKQSIQHALDNLKKIDNSGHCPVCNIHFQSMYAHLYEKHGLIKVKK